VVAARVTLREITNEEGNRLLRIVRRTSGSVVTWRRAQIVLLSAQGLTPTRISEVVFTDPDTVREVIHNFNRDGFDALYPRYAGGRPQTFTLPKRQEIKRIALTDPQDLDQPFATWSLSKLADYVVAEGVVTDISHEGLRRLLREEGVRFQAVRTWKRSNDPNFEAKRDRIVELYDLAEQGDAVVICLDEFGPLNLQPQPGGQSWAPRAKPRRIRATYTRPHGVRHLISAYDVGADRLYGHIKKRKSRVEFLEFCRYIRSLYPPEIRLHFVLDNFSPHLGEQVRAWAAANNVELASTPFYASWLNRIEAQFRALRYFTLAGTDHPDHATQARLIRRYIAWRNRNTNNPRLRALINTANVA
jgi:transposase